MEHLTEKGTSAWSHRGQSWLAGPAITLSTCRLESCYASPHLVRLDSGQRWECHQRLQRHTAKCRHESWLTWFQKIGLMRYMLSRFLTAFLSRSKCIFNFMAAVTVCSDFGAWEDKICCCFCFSPVYLPWSDGTRCHDLSFLMLSFKPAFHSLLSPSSGGSLLPLHFLSFVYQKEFIITLLGCDSHTVIRLALLRQAEIFRDWGSCS